MKVTFETDASMERSLAKIVTNPAEQMRWDEIDKAISHLERQLVVINPKNNRNVQIQPSSILAIESEDRMCNVRVISGESYLLGKRLKYVEEDLDSSQFLKINNSTMINVKHIQTFAATDHARIQVELKDGSSYYVSRYYIKNFRGNYYDRKSQAFVFSGIYNNFAMGHAADHLVLQRSNNPDGVSMEPRRNCVHRSRGIWSHVRCAMELLYVETDLEYCDLVYH
ncbi:LytTR family transcriptional regulator [Paenibacillus sp. CC-CFT742]|nr:LytTR family DNA-binding domain-containing protein [Paenibacillus sp. CC-CFT742]WJH30587.1 LytTR family transcriptional regulator [Paenibacillus sp. CC-CFT742]